MSKAIYFVGAGLSKSLQLEKPIPLLADFIKVAAHYAWHDERPIVLIQLIGIELLNRFRWPSPVARALAESINVKKIDPALAAAFADALKRRPSESIEDLLARETDNQNFGFEAVYDPIIRFRYAISRIFSLIGWDVALEKLRAFLEHRFAMSDGQHTFVSFNYDLYLDRLIQEVVNDWHWHCGYGFEIPYFVTEDPDDSGVDSETAADHTCQTNVLILKPHGSLHWLVPIQNPNAPMPFSDGPVVIRIDDDGKLDYVHSVPNWPRVRYPDEGIPTDVAPGIIPPLRRKDARIEIFVKTRALEFDAVRQADEAFVLGWSLPFTDDDQRCLIRYAVQLRGNPLDRVVVVNLNQGPEYYERVAETFGVSRKAVEVWNNGFEDYLSTCC